MTPPEPAAREASQEDAPPDEAIFGDTLLIEGPIASGRTSRLIARAVSLIEAGEGEKTLILASNPMRQHDLADRLLSQCALPMGQLPLHTFAGFVRNALFNAWPAVEARLMASDPPGAPPSAPHIRPSLGGMEDSELLLRLLIADGRARDPGFFAAFEGSDRALLKQLARRLRLRAENRLSRAEMRQRAVQRQEPCARDTAQLDAAFDRLCYQLRALDANKQTEAFFGLLSHSEEASMGALTPFAASIRRDIRHLLVEDVDETTAAQQAFIHWLAPSLHTLTMTCDPQGGSRQGYLNAYPQGWQALKALRPDAQLLALTRDDRPYRNAGILANNWRQAPEAAIPLESGSFSAAPRSVTRLEMLDQLASDIVSWLDQGRAPGEIAIITPHDDILTRQALQARLQQRGIPLQWLSGTERPYDQPACRAYVTLLHWLNAPRWQAPLSPVEIRALLVHGLRLGGSDPASLQAIAAQWAGLAVDVTQDATQDAALALSEANQQRLAAFLSWSGQARELPFETQLYKGFSEVIAEFSSGGEDLSQIQRVMESYVRQKALWQGLNALRGPAESPDAHAFERRWLAQVKSGVVADTPDAPVRPDPEAILAGTPQKIIDAGARRAIQAWLDVGSRHWTRTDRAPLYDAAVYAPDALHTDASDDGPEREASRDALRAACLTRTLMALAGERTRAYASELDDAGEPQTGVLEALLKTESPETLDLSTISRPRLRPDQRPILDYRHGTLAISAAPGAGKTYVNTALILELIASGVAPQQILALTYMDSAARTLQTRLKSLLGGHAPLPTVCTIHSLALRMLSERDHAARVGFFPTESEESGGIVDESAQDLILSTFAARLCPEDVSIPAWMGMMRRGISHAKTWRLSPDALAHARVTPPFASRLKMFQEAYRLYEEHLKATGRVDFTDIILKAVELLEQHADAREYYQAQFAYVLEDEAQDSSALLQRLLTLLGGEKPNLIRTGDPNQSITTTFSAADPQAFRDFAAQADHVVTLDRSGRCAPEIMRLANGWLAAMRARGDLPDAFSPMTMRGVSSQEGPTNPSLLLTPKAVWLESDLEEGDWLTAEIQAFRRAHPQASVAVLTLTNDQALAWSDRLQRAGIEAIALTDRLNMNAAFSVLLAYLRLLASPGDCQAQLACYDAMVSARLTAFSAEQRAFLSERALMAQSPATLAGLHDAFLAQWAYDLRDFSRDSLGRRITRLLTRLSDRLFTSPADRSNGYLCALQAESFLQRRADELDESMTESLSPLEWVIQGFEALERSPRQRRSFSDLLNAEAADGFVRVMTLHKAKGQEFDLACMPGLRADKFRVDETDKTILALEAARLGEALAPDAAQRLLRQKQEERARLIYVGLTRARRGLLLSGARLTRNRFGRRETAEPSLAFETLSRLICEPDSDIIQTGPEQESAPCAGLSS
ncbi:MAG: ATP-dependent helicase [Vampirovibrionales bacterium]|nr:ATP-dependent helicase [Vampirovibrionales bacterium]